MYEFLSIKVKCPTCGESLMDHEKQVDNQSSIKLIVKKSGQEGILRLSSIYGSHNYSSDMEFELDEIVDLICPNCKTKFQSENICKSCSGPMVYFTLDMGGKVSICERVGCKNHSVEFEDLSLAMAKLYQEYGFRGRPYPKDLDLRADIPDIKDPEDEKLEIIETGTYLQTYCPHCKKSLIDNQQLKLKIINGDTGFLLMSPYLNVFSSKSTIVLPEDKKVTDIQCYHCDKSLLSETCNCQECGSPAAKLSVSARSRLVDFYFCSKKGCKWHSISEDALNDIRLEDSLEW